MVRHVVLFFLFGLALIGRCQAETEKSRVQVWQLLRQRVEVSKWAFGDYLKNDKDTRSLTLFQTEARLGVLGPGAVDLDKIIAKAKVKPEAVRLLGESDSFGLYVEGKKRWYIFDLERGEHPSFHLGPANVAFERVLVLSSEMITSSEKTLVHAVRRAIATAENN